VPAGELAARWGVPRCELFRQLPSTLDAIHQLGIQGAPVGTTVIAEEQTAGRGRDGRTWHSPPGGVWLGVLFRPQHAVPGTVAIRAGLAVADTVDALLGGPVARLKWPNDVLLDDRKLAGVLCEGRWQGERLQWLAVGVGVAIGFGLGQWDEAIGGGAGGALGALGAAQLVVGTLLTAFGTFWALEGLGVSWPQADADIAALVVIYVLAAATFVGLMRRRTHHAILEAA